MTHRPEIHLRLAGAFVRRVKLAVLATVLREVADHPIAPLLTLSEDSPCQP